MKKVANAPHGGGVLDSRRRLILAGLVAAYGSSFIPWARAQQVGAASVTMPESFMQVSKILTGQASLDSKHAARLYQALVSDDAAFGERHRLLLAYIDAHKASPMQLQAMLDAEKSPLATVPRRIVTAWYTGIVGEGERAKCIMFETNLLNVLTADKLRPPSYSYGVYGSWAAKPV
jgi:hypothetical protein